MNHYELLTLVSGHFAENEVETAFQKIESVVKKYDCPIHYRQNLDRKRLAYPIDHQLYGYYFLMEFDAEPAQIGKIDREFKLASDVMRHTIVKRKTVGKPKTAERKTSLEQEAFGKSFDRAKLGLDEALAPIENSVPEAPLASAMPPAPAVPTAIDEQGVATSEVAEPEVGQQPAPISSEPADQRALIQPQKASKSKEKKTIEDKVSFEELDKKLEDILKNDII
ncbi:30S ribosomal protein S6 [Candidatus Uhrbacteria bacterium]|nr:30S ribosomal protein S6 [Candidatus Uhrbacteria bacterium]